LTGNYALSAPPRLRMEAGVQGERNPRLEGCLPVPVPAGSRGRVPFLQVLVVLAGPVRRRVLVRLPDPFDTVDLFDVLRDYRRHQGFPVAAFEHPLADDGPGEPLAVHERRRRNLETVLPEQPYDEIRVRIHDIKPGTRDVTWLTHTLCTWVSGIG